MLVVYLLDQSGSMNPCALGQYSDVLRDGLDKLIQEMPDVDHHCIVFSETAEGGKTFASLPKFNHCTNIENGLKVLLAHLEERSADNVVVVFLSDGADDDADTIVGRIHALPDLKSGTCNVVTVAVGDFFPTGMAIELRNKFQTDLSAEADGRPFVIEMSRTPESARLTAKRVGLFVKDVLHPAKVIPRLFPFPPLFLMPAWQPLTLDDIHGDTPLEDVKRLCEERYRRCAIRCLNPAYKASSPLELVEDTLAFLTTVQSLLFAPRPGEDARPLPTNLIARRRFGFLQDFRAKLNVLRSQSAARQALSSLSDVKKQELLGFNVFYDEKRYAKAASIRPANLGAAMDSVLQLLEVYRGDVDASLPDPYDAVGFVRQSEIFKDAAACQEVLDGLKACESIAGILKWLPLVGRVFKRSLEPNALNPYAQVLEFGEVVRVASTEALHCSYRDLDGNDTLILFGGHPKGLPFFVNSQSFLLLDNPDCSHADALIAGAYLWLVALMKTDLPSWALEELGMVEQLVDTQTSGWWRKYVEHAAGEDFFQCLVTESAEFADRKYLRCPHPGKFLVALWYGIAKGKRYTVEELRRRMFALSVEILGRRDAYGCNATTLFNVEGVDVEGLLAKTWQDTKCLDTPYRSVQEAETLFAQEARAALRAACSDTTIGCNAEMAKGASLYGLYIGVLEKAFAYLARTCGHESCRLSDEEVAMAAQIATKSSSLERCVLAGAWTGGELSIWPELKKVVTAKFLYKQEVQAKAFCRKTYEQLLMDTHTGVPTPVSLEFAARYQEETGRDIVKDFEVDTLTGLCRNACCFKDCMWYLVRAKPGHNSRVKCHFKEALGDFVPGLHRTIFLHREEGMGTIMDRIEEGSDLVEPRLSKWEARNVGYMNEDKREEYAQGIKEKKKATMREGIKKLLERMAPEFLECAVTSVLSAADSKEQTYGEFKADFDKAYGEPAVVYV